MYDQVLKFGAMIVDALSEFKSGPVLIYIPPLGELRGGAWAVLDKSINPSKIELFADPNSRSGVLEPEGTVKIKLKDKNLQELMCRFDQQMKELQATLNSGNLTTEEIGKTSELTTLRSKSLHDAYHNLAIQFADLHDMPRKLSSNIES